MCVGEYADATQFEVGIGIIGENGDACGGGLVGLENDVYNWNSMSIQNNGAQQLASEATIYIILEDVNDEIPLFTEREQEMVAEGEPVGTRVTQVNAIDKDGTAPNNLVSLLTIWSIMIIFQKDAG